MQVLKRNIRLSGIAVLLIQNREDACAVCAVHIGLYIVAAVPYVAGGKPRPAQRQLKNEGIRLADAAFAGRNNEFKFIFRQQAVDAAGKRRARPGDVADDAGTDAQPVEAGEQFMYMGHAFARRGGCPEDFFCLRNADCQFNTQIIVLGLQKLPFVHFKAAVPRLLKTLEQIQLKLRGLPGRYAARIAFDVAKQFLFGTHEIQVRFTEQGTTVVKNHHSGQFSQADSSFVFQYTAIIPQNFHQKTKIAKTECAGYAIMKGNFQDRKGSILLNQLIRRLLSCLMICVLLTAPVSGYALEKSTNPLLGGLSVDKYTKTKDKIVNILLLGIDYGYEQSDYISAKDELNDCHTDANVVVSINKTQKTVDLISLPRDVLSYVPGVKGIYKLNAAVNCAKDIKSGVEKTRETVSWHLGGIEIHHYAAVDVPALIALGDAIGGIDYDLEMSYTATSGHYEKGWQHLDGQGIMDYMRARKNAPVGGTDLGRTERQRKMLSAILQKIKGQPGLIFKCVGVLFDKDVNIFTDIGFFDAISLAAAALRVDMSTIETHVLDGKLQDFYSNFNFTDQEARREMLMNVFGIEAEDTPFVSNRHTRWLLNEGFEAAKYINLAEELLSQKKLFRNPKQKEARKALEEAHDAAVLAFDAAALEQSGDNRNALLDKRNQLKKAIENVTVLTDYEETIRYKVNDPWYEDPMINEYQYNWN